MDFRILTFDELDKGTLYDILNLRSRVFVVEQGVRYLDPDGYDRRCYHMLCTEGDELVGYLRILPAGLTFDTPAIGRIIAVERGKGIGSAMMERAIRYIEDTMHADVISLEGQSRLIGFYGRFGFETCGEEFLEGGIPHYNMVRRKK